jgi:hypothetical protein
VNKEADAEQRSIGRGLVVAGFALAGWAVCGAVMGAGMQLFSLQTALAIHAIAAPLTFLVISTIYFKRFAYTKPLSTAAAFVAIVIFMDVVVVAGLLQRSFEMFSSFAGTWLPFVLIFTSTYVAGVLLRSSTCHRSRQGDCPAP